MANTNHPRRIIKEMQRLLSEPALGISASPSEENMRYFNVWSLAPRSRLTKMFGMAEKEMEYRVELFNRLRALELLLLQEKEHT